MSVKRWARPSRADLLADALVWLSTSRRGLGLLVAVLLAVLVWWLGAEVKAAVEGFQ